MKWPSHRLFFFTAVCVVSLGCDDERQSNNASPGVSPGAAADGASAVPGHFTGRITRPDGTPIAIPGVEYEVAIVGVTGVGENTRVLADVAADGTFKQRLPAGLFQPALGTITVPFEGKSYKLWLEPVAPYTGRRDSAEGIRQDFVWRITGTHPDARNPHPNNVKDWYGCTFPVSYSAFRSDIQQPVPKLPDGSKIVFTLTPTSKVVDGSEGKTLTVERIWHADGRDTDALNDLPPASYEVAAVATLPDGSTKTLLFQEVYRGPYAPKARAVLQPSGGSDNHYVYLPRSLYWVAP